MMMVTSGSASWSVLARVSRAFLKRADCCLKGSGPSYFDVPSAFSVSTACGKDITKPCGGNDSSGLRSSPLAYSGHISGGRDKSGVCEVPMPSTILAIMSYISTPTISRFGGSAFLYGVGGAQRSHIRTVFRKEAPRRRFTGRRAVAAQWEDSNQPIGADHGPTRTVPTSVSAVASLHARPWRLADAASGAGRHRVTVGAACGVATLGRAVAACDADRPGRFHRTSLAAHPGAH